MWGWIVQGSVGARRAGTSLALVALASVGLTATTGSSAAAGPISFRVPGGQVRVLDMPRRDRAVRAAVALTVSEELSNQRREPLLPIDRARCPTGEVIITLEKQARLQGKWASVSSEEKRLAALLIDGSPCRMWLNARAMRRMDQARVCNIVRHELGHARGLEHATTGIMVPVLPLLPGPGCDWAESTWLDDET